METVRQDEEVSLKYMKVYEREHLLESRGETKGEVKIIRNMSKSMKPDEIAGASGLDQEYIQKILAYIQKYPKESDSEIMLRIRANEITPN